MQELGMGGVAADIVSAKHKIQDKYLKAESQVGCPYHIYTSMRTYLLSGLICSLTFDVLNAMVLVSPAHWIIKVAIAFCSVVQVFSALKSISKLKTDMQAYHQLDKDGETDETTLKLAGTFESIDKLQTEFEGRQRPVWETEHHGPKIVERSLSFVRDALAPPSTTSNQQLKKYELPTEGRLANLAATHEETGEAVLAKGDVTSTTPPEEKEGWWINELDEELYKKDTGEVPTEGRLANLAATHEDTGEAVLAKGDVTSTSPPEEKEGWEFDELDEELSKKDTGEVPQ
jgi:hypothetical protein